jgi:hypothetical protein
LCCDIHDRARSSAGAGREAGSEEHRLPRLEMPQPGEAAQRAAKRLARSPIAPTITRCQGRLPLRNGSVSIERRHGVNCLRHSPSTRERPRFRGDNDYGERKRPAPSDFVERNAGACSLRGTPEPVRAQQALGKLFAWRGGIHVDFHANLHFDDLRCFPGH